MWVARDKDEDLWLYTDKPKRSQTNCWWEADTQTNPLDADEVMLINRELFPDLSWEDEPIEVDLVRKEEKKWVK